MFKKVFTIPQLQFLIENMCWRLTYGYVARYFYPLNEKADYATDWRIGPLQDSADVHERPGMVIDLQNPVRAQFPGGSEHLRNPVRGPSLQSVA